jgi:hypothetical protein
MNHNYIQVIACVLLSFSGYSASIAQSTDPEFLNCSSTPDSLCIEDEGIRLPSNNQLFLGEEDPEASSCSVHVTQKKRVRSHCGDTLQYEVLLFLNDTSSVYILKSLTTVITDSLGEVELTFNTEESADEIIRQSGIPYTQGCGDEHLIKWVVVDDCGGFSVCEQRVDLYDCSMLAVETPASPYIISIPSGCQITLHAIDYFIGGLDDCSLQDQYTYSFEPDTYRPIMDIECPEAFGVELPWQMWVADAGRDLNCDGQIDWNEKNKVELPFIIIVLDNGICDCHMETGHTISGKAITGPGQGIKGVEISLHSPGHVFPTYITDSDGTYTYNNVNVSGELEIRAYKNDFHKNGVSTLDLVKIQKHLLGIEEMDSPYDIIAADANNSQNVSAIDLIEIRKLILGIYTAFPANLSWRFVQAGYVFQDTMNPWPIDDPETITITDLSNPGNLDFIGIKIGDVNGTVQPNFTQLLPREPLLPFEFIAEQQSFQADDIINVDFRMPSDRLLTGFQFTLAAAEMEIMNIVPGKIRIGDEHYAILDDKMTISWFDENSVEVEKDEVLFALQLRAKKSGALGHSLSINSDITEAEIYLDGAQTFLPVLVVQNQDNIRSLEIISCYPNPWKEQTSIQFYLPESDYVTVSLFDATGRRIQSSSELLPGGYHQHQISSAKFPDRGIVFVEISTPEHNVIQRMIVLD